jgi:hypothetical protein
MLKRVKQSKRSADVSGSTGDVLDRPKKERNDSIGLPTKAQISMFMARLGSKGGKVGGKRRLETMTRNERREIARKAAETRWKKR